MNSYSVIAKIYDNANTDFDYDKYYEFTKHYLTGKVVELACGSGAFTAYLVKNVDSVIAVDSCSQMLEIAIQNNFKNRKYIQFVENDLQNFTPPSKVNGVIAVCDGFNYISPDKIKNVFEKIYGYLKNGGYFIFDISSEHKLKNIIGNNIFYEDNDDYTYLWTNKLYDNYVKMDIALFEASGDMYTRADESHIQYIHKVCDLKNILNEIGFDTSVFDGEKFSYYTDNSVRVLFVCKKSVKVSN